MRSPSRSDGMCAAEFVEDTSAAEGALAAPIREQHHNGFTFLRGRYPRGEVLCCADDVDGRVLHSATELPVLVGRNTNDSSDWYLQLRQVFGESPDWRLALCFAATREERAQAMSATAAANAMGLGLRTVWLPAGCRVVDVQRLHGADGVRALLEDRLGNLNRAKIPRPVNLIRQLEKWRSESGDFAAAMVDFLEELLASGRSRDDCRELSYKLERYRRECAAAGHASLSQLSAATAREIQRRLLDASTDRRSSVPAEATRRVLVAARAFIVWAARSGRARSDLAEAFVRLPRAAPSPPDVLSEDEIERVLAQMLNQHVVGQRDRAMAEIFYSTGIRRAELVGLNLGDIDFSRRALVVRYGKGRRSRVVPVGNRALEWLERYLTTARRLQLRNVSEVALFLGRSGTRIATKTVTARMRA